MAQSRVSSMLIFSVLAHSKVENYKFPSNRCYISNYIMEVPSTPK